MEITIAKCDRCGKTFHTYSGLYFCENNKQLCNEQAMHMLKAKLECLKHETSGMYSDCNRCNCDECSLNYEQGNMGEQKEALDMAIKALEQTTWIPVSERLPEIKQHVLLSCYGRVVYGRLEDETGNGGHPLFSICDSVGESRPIVLETTVHNEFTTGRITAWRPLPEPYKEDKKLS